MLIQCQMNVRWDRQGYSACHKTIWLHGTWKFITTWHQPIFESCTESLHIFKPYFCKVCFNIIIQPKPKPSWDLPANMLGHLCFSSFVQYVLLVPFAHLTTLTILGEDCELRICPVCYFLLSTAIFTFPRFKFRYLYDTEDILNHTSPIFLNTSVSFFHHPLFCFQHVLNHAFDFYNVTSHLFNCSQVNLKNAVPLDRNSWHNQDHLKRTHHLCLLRMTRRESRLWSFQLVTNNLIKRTNHDQKEQKVTSYINSDMQHLSVMGNLNSWNFGTFCDKGS
jgi:hypothetical protein